MTVPQHQPSTSGSGPGPYLSITSAGGTRTIRLDRPRLEVGRDPSCAIVVADQTVSRRHIVLDVDANAVHFRDLGGTNIPLLDGRPTREGELRPGARLTLGATQLSIHPTGPTPPSLALVEPDVPTQVMRRRDHERHAPDVVRARLETIRAMRWTPVAGPDLVAARATAWLATALRITTRTRGMLARRAADGQFVVLAAAPPEASRIEIRLPAADAITEPLVLAPWPPGDPLAERILVPIAPDLLAIVAHPAPDGLPSRDALELLTAFAASAAFELADAAEREHERQELEQLRFQRSVASRTVEASARLGPLRRHLTEATALGLPIRLVGENGCEFEELARYAHAVAPLQRGTFVPCYARFLPTHRVAEELASDAAAEPDVPTCDVRARGGTLFVDSPEALPPELQQHLAGLLERERQVPDAERFRLVLASTLVGGDMPALDPALEHALRNAAVYRVPPLRSAPDDVVAIASVILDDLGPGPSGAPRRVDAAAEQRLTTFHWPGNVNQLRRVIEIAASRAGGEPIGLAELPDEIRGAHAQGVQVKSLQQVEFEHIVRVLAMCGGNKVQAAKALRISPSTLYARLRDT